MTSLGGPHLTVLNLTEHPCITSQCIIQSDNKSSAVAGMGDGLATIDMGRKPGADVPPFRESWVPSNTTWPGPRPTFIPSRTSIHPTVWPQYTNVTDRQTQTDRQDRQRSDSTGRSVLQTERPVITRPTALNGVN